MYESQLQEHKKKNDIFQFENKYLEQKKELEDRED